MGWGGDIFYISSSHNLDSVTLAEKAFLGQLVSLWELVYIRLVEAVPAQGALASVIKPASVEVALDTVAAGQAWTHH